MFGDAHGPNPLNLWGLVTSSAIVARKRRVLRRAHTRSLFANDAPISVGVHRLFLFFVFVSDAVHIRPPGPLRAGPPPGRKGVRGGDRIPGELKYSTVARRQPHWVYGQAWPKSGPGSLVCGQNVHMMRPKSGGFSASPHDLPRHGRRIAGLRIGAN